MNHIFSAMRLKWLSLAAGKYVKLHPNIENTRLDVPRVFNVLKTAKKHKVGRGSTLEEAEG